MTDPTSTSTSATIPPGTHYGTVDNPNKPNASTASSGPAPGASDSEAERIARKFAPDVGGTGKVIGGKIEQAAAMLLSDEEMRQRGLQKEQCVQSLIRCYILRFDVVCIQRRVSKQRLLKGAIVLHLVVLSHRILSRIV